MKTASIPRETATTAESKFEWILEDARKHFTAGMNWMDFSNRYFEPGSRFMPAEPMERKEYLASPEFREIQEMKYELEKRQPDITEPEDIPMQRVYSGKLNIRIPKSLHRSLVAEAEREGTSLNQLILAKLARPL